MVDTNEAGRKSPGSVLALDTSSTATGWAFYDGERVTAHGVLKLRQPRNPELTADERTQLRLRQLASDLDGLMQRLAPSRIVAEDCFKSDDPKLKSAGQVLAECRGVVAVLSAQHGLPLVRYVSPIRAKREMWNYAPYSPYRRGRREWSREEQKELMVRAVSRRGFRVSVNKAGIPSDDEADAIGILLTYLGVASDVERCRQISPSNAG